MIGGGVTVLIAGAVLLRKVKPVQEVGTDVPETGTDEEPFMPAVDYPPVGKQPENVPEGHIWMHDGAFRVVMTTHSGQRARKMFENGTPGQGETLELFQGPDRRGRK